MISSMKADQEKKYRAITMLAYFVGLTGLFLPAEIIQTESLSYSIYLWYQHSGKVAGLFLVAGFVWQGTSWLTRKQWPSWPAIVSGIYVASFAIQRFVSLSYHQHPAESLSETAAVSTHAAIGLYLLAMAGTVLIFLGIFSSRMKK